MLPGTEKGLFTLRVYMRDLMPFGVRTCGVRVSSNAWEQTKQSTFARDMVRRSRRHFE